MRPRTLWILFAAFILYGGTIPFHFSGSVDHAWARLSELSLDPFVSPDTGRRVSIPDVVQNVLLFVPFGVFGMLTFLGFGSRERHRSHGGTEVHGVLRILLRIFLVTVLGAALSALVEFVQLFTADRVSSVADLATNTFGTFAGAVATLLVASAVKLGLARLRREGLAIAELRPLAFASVILAIAFLQPFDVTLEVGAVASDIRMLERDAWQFAVLRDEGISIIICAFFSATLASYLSVLGESRAGRTTLFAGAIAIVMLEGSQFLIGSRTPSLWDVLVGWTGLILGVALWRQTTRIAAPGVWIALIALATFVAAAMQMLSPFQWTAEYRPMSWFPFRGYYTRTTFETLSHVIELALLYVPLGYWVGATSVGSGSARRALLTTGALTVAIAGTVEYLQGWAAGRYSDVSDVGLCLLGAAAGVWAGRRAIQGLPSEVPGRESP